MSIETHIAQLEDRHRSLDTLLASLHGSPSATDAEVKKVKQQKLRLKDQIAQLRH